MNQQLNNDIENLLTNLSDNFNNSKEIAIILAAGHGKRIKSQRSKMLHRIWEIPTVERVYRACKNGIPDCNTIVVVGIKAADVMNVIGKRPANKFAYQKEQLGTGHAVQVAMSVIDSDKDFQTVYVLPGDMGLLDAETMKKFREDFESANYDMMVLTGIYNGDPKKNYYGRIVRVKEKTIDGKPSGEDFGKVIEIIEYKDILALDEETLYTVEYRNKKYGFTKTELLEINEYNSGVYAFNYDKLKVLINQLTSDNAQNEIYITDLIYLFNKNGFSVGAVSPENDYVVMGFNDKTVLKEMEAIARRKIFDRLKNIIEIADPDDFFIHEKVVEQIEEMDKKGIPLDISLDKGVYIGENVKLNYNNHFGRAVFIDGNVILGENVRLQNMVHLSCFPHQQLIVGNNVEILWSDIIKGNIQIGDNSRIESSVNITGSDEYPTRIGKNVLIKGTSYLFGTIVEDGVFIEHSVLIRKKIRAVKDENGNIRPVRFYIPIPEGADLVRDIR
jgi:bifunctional UDP-N-acetylglucosamine pyrophosphorylase/glucosamine-1-phosphate N-acetyltransferase